MSTKQDEPGRAQLPARVEPDSPLDLILPYRKRTPDDVLRTNFPWEGTRELLLTYFSVFHGLKVKGYWNVPPEGPVIFAPNHVSYYDPPLIAACIPYRVRTMAWNKLFVIPWMGYMIRAYGGFPVKLRSADKGAVAETLKLLRNHESLVVFPEGERGRSGALQEFEKGVARIAMQTGAAIVPVSITGAFEAFPRYNTLPRWCKRITVKFHSPVYVTETTSRAGLADHIAEINEAISRPIRRRLSAYYRLTGNQELAKQYRDPGNRSEPQTNHPDQ